MATDAGTQGTPQADLDQENVPLSMGSDLAGFRFCGFESFVDQTAYPEKLGHAGDGRARALSGEERGGSIKDTPAKTRPNGICCQTWGHKVCNEASGSLPQTPTSTS